MRDKHCHFKKLDHNGRCIASCHYNWKSMFEKDCTGKERAETRYEIKKQLEDKLRGLH